MEPKVFEGLSNKCLLLTLTQVHRERIVRDSWNRLRIRDWGGIQGRVSPGDQAEVSMVGSRLQVQ